MKRQNQNRQIGQNRMCKKSELISEKALKNMFYYTKKGIIEKI